MNHVFKTFTSALLGAAALARLATGCVREQFNTNPNYDSESNTVRTKFVLNVNTKADGDTKMTAENVQRNNNFLGMQDVHILTYELGESNTPKTTGAGSWDAPTIDSRVGKFFFNPVNTKATEDYNYGNLFEVNGITAEKQSRTLELAFPLGTNGVVIYGKAKNSEGPENQGSVVASGDPSNLASLKFSLVPRIDPNSTNGKKPFLAGAVVFQSILTSLTLASLVQDNHYWTTTGVATTDESEYLQMAPGATFLVQDKRYRVWTPVNTEDPYYPSINLTKSNGASYYEDGDTYKPEGSSTTYTMRSGNCSWRMLGDMYKAKHDGDENTTVEAIRSTCHAGQLEFVPLLELLGQAYYNLMRINEIKVSTDQASEAVHVGEEPVYIDPNDQSKGYLKTTYHELRAGSAAAILRTMRDLDFIVHKCLSSAPTSWSEVVAQQLAKEIDSRLDLYFTGHQDAMLFRDATSIMSNLTNRGVNLTEVDLSVEMNNPEATGAATFFSDHYVKGTGTSNTLDGSAGFPMNVGLPMGSAYLETIAGDLAHPFTPDRFVFKEDIPAYAFGLNTRFNIFNYCYPAELMYFGNSPLHTSNKEHTEGQYPATTDNWRWDKSNNGNTVTKSWTDDWTKFSSVNSTTTSVAMAMPINYGSALLKATVVYGDNVTTLLDNNKGIHPNENPKAIKVIGTAQDPVNTGLVVTGIVVGGQPKAVTWDYTRMPDHTEDSNGKVTTPPDYTSVSYSDGKFNNLFYTQDKFGMMIYDKLATQFRIGDPGLATGGNVIYTLCFDNYAADETADKQSDVYIALELRNETGEDFWGETNLIRKGGTFYLVGKLNLKNLLNTVEYNTVKGKMARDDYYYPPYDPATGETIKVPRVFMQDYVTSATLTLQQDALQHAYMTVPDLRSNQVSLGVAVDIKWEEGLSFNVNMGVLE